MNKERLSLIQGVLDEMVETKWAAGASVLVFRHGKEQCYYQAGYRDIEAGKKIERDSIFRMYSMTKPLTSALVMKLLEDGKLDLLDPVHMYLPGFKNQKYIDGDKLVDVELPVNIKQLQLVSSMPEVLDSYSFMSDINAEDYTYFVLPCQSLMIHMNIEPIKCFFGAKDRFEVLEKYMKQKLDDEWRKRIVFNN